MDNFVGLPLLPDKKGCKNAGAKGSELGFEFSIPCVMLGYKLLASESFLNISVLEEDFTPRNLNSRFFFNHSKKVPKKIWNFTEFSKPTPSVEFEESSKSFILVVSVRKPPKRFKDK